MNKGYMIIAAVMFLSMLIFPLAATSDNSSMLKGTNAAKPVNAEVTNVKDPEKMQTFRIKLTKSGKVSKIELLEYLIGVVAGEMNADSENEALKAQAVAAHTLLLYRKNENAKKDHDITDDSSTDQCYIDRSAREKKWGENFEKYEKKLSLAVSDVMNKTVCYNNKPILAVYCDTSGGKTESAENVWGGKTYPYLVPVESVSDMLSPQYLSTVTYTADEFAAMASSLKVTLKDDRSKWVGASSCTESGTVTKINLGGKDFSGEQLRTAFNLRSANFDLEYSGEKFVFTVRGYGHGVGMSQYGANYMASEGSKYDEILKWYYTKCKIVG